MTDLIIDKAPDFTTPEATAATITAATVAMEQLKSRVEKELENYSPDFFAGDIAKAKTARAELNASSKKINDLRKDYEKRYMAAFNGFKGLASETVKLIDAASGEIDKIVKDIETAEKEAKKACILEYWQITGFNLFDLDKVFTQKWLNKTCDMKDIRAEIDAIQARTYADLKTLEAFPDEGGTIKALYLDSLDIGQAVAKARAMQEAKERAELEAKARAERERQEAIKEQCKAEEEEQRDMQRDANIAGLVSEAMGHNAEQAQEVADPVQVVTLQFTGRRSQLLKLREFMTCEGITYQVIEQ